MEKAISSSVIGVAAKYWDPSGPMRALHHVAPLRLSYLTEIVRKHLPGRTDGSLSGLRVLDVGCGGGVCSEMMARKGAAVVGVDSCAEAVQVASYRAAQQPQLQLSYKCLPLPDDETKDTFDVVMASSVCEQAPDPCRFLKRVSSSLVGGGLLIVSGHSKSLASCFLASTLPENVAALAAAHLLWERNWASCVHPDDVKGFLEAECSCEYLGTQGVVPYISGSSPWFPYFQVDFAVSSQFNSLYYMVAAKMRQPPNPK